MTTTFEKLPQFDLPTILDDGSGYRYRGVDVEGFGDDLALPVEARRMVARFAAAMTPGRLTAEQESLLRGVGPSTLLGDLAVDESELDELWQAGIYELLTPQQRATLRDPTLHPNVDASYPLAIGDVARLSGATERQLRYWEENGLLRSYRASDGSRRYLRSAVLKAMAYQDAPQHVRQTLASILREGPTRFVRLLTAALGEGSDLVEALGELREPDDGAAADAKTTNRQRNARPRAASSRSAKSSTTKSTRARPARAAATRRSTASTASSRGTRRSNASPTTPAGTGGTRRASGSKSAVRRSSSRSTRATSTRATQSKSRRSAPTGGSATKRSPATKTRARGVGTTSRATQVRATKAGARTSTKSRSTRASRSTKSR